MSVHGPSADERLLPPATRSLEPICANSRYRSRLDHFRVTRSRNSQKTIRGTVIRSNRGDTSTATKINVKQRDKEGFTLQHPAKLKIFSFTIPLMAPKIFK